MNQPPTFDDLASVSPGDLLTADGECSPDDHKASPRLQSATKPKRSLFRTIWRWHFYAGLILGPILIVIAATGALYVFKAELSRWMYRDLYYYSNAGTPLPYDEQLKIAEQAAPGLELEGMFLSIEPGRTTQFVAHVNEGGDFNPEQKHKAFFMNPVTGEIVGTQVLEDGFFAVVLQIHRTLFAGIPGRIVSELATSWALVLIATGIYLWWPRSKNAKGVWFPRLKGKLYTVLRDCHAVSGVYVAALAAFIVGTGMFFTFVWGTGYMLTMAATGASPMTLFAQPKAPPPRPDIPPAELDQVIEEVKSHAEPGDTILFRFAETADVAHNAFLLHEDDKNSLRVIVIDQYAGNTLKVTRIQDAPPMLYLYALAASIHMGLVFGLPTKILALVTCLALIGIAVTGIWMWWERRPRGRTGFPQRPDVKIPVWLGTLMVASCIVLPVMGVSVLLILGGEWLWGRINRRSQVTAA